jgi:hypothetical protein
MVWITLFKIYFDANEEVEDREVEGPELCEQFVNKKFPT